MQGHENPGAGVTHIRSYKQARIQVEACSSDPEVQARLNQLLVATLDEDKKEVPPTDDG